MNRAWYCIFDCQNWVIEIWNFKRLHMMVLVLVVLQMLIKVFEVVWIILTNITFFLIFNRKIRFEMEFHQMHVSPNMSQQLFHNIFSYCRIFLKLQRKSNQNEYTQSTKLFNIIKALSVIVIKRENNSSQPVDAVSYYAFLLILAPTGWIH